MFIQVENMRKKYRDKLSACRENILKHKGEMGMMKKKGVTMQKDMENQREEVSPSIIKDTD